MCWNGEPDRSKSERENLQGALSRVRALKRGWCSDGQLVIDAAAKYLDTLPKTRTVWHVNGVGRCESPYSTTISVDRLDAIGQHTRDLLRQGYARVTVTTHEIQDVSR